MPPEAPRGGMGAAVGAARQAARKSLLRNHGGGHAPVSNLELFFDLVYVFAITQISHFLNHHLDPLGLLEGTMLFLALWWAWMYTTWATNWLNPDRIPVRLLLLALMLLSLAMAVALPRAFADHALVFAAAYVALQLGRSVVVAVMFRLEDRPNAFNMVRISLWFAGSAALWMAGALQGGKVQLLCWTAALAIEYAGPAMLYRVPFLGHSSTRDWDISGSHMAERSSLFIIIALGEGIVVTGTSFAGLSMETGRIGAFLIAFVSSALMWWLYFDLGAERGARMIAGHDQVGRIARNAYTYLHMPIVLGIVISAVADALMLEHWNRTVSLAFIGVQCGGLMLYLAGIGLFKRFANTYGNFPFSHWVAIVLIAMLGAAAWLGGFSAAALAAACCAVLLLASVWEWHSYHGGLMERLEARGYRAGTWMRRRSEARLAARQMQHTP